MVISCKTHVSSVFKTEKYCVFPPCASVLTDATIVSLKLLQFTIHKSAGI